MYDDRGRTGFYIPRLFYIETRFYSRRTLASTGLDAFLGLSSGLEEVIEEYKTVFHGVIVQDPVSEELELIKPGEKIVFKKCFYDYCRWHNGSLIERDNPLLRTYCLKKPYSGLGYCREHHNSIRAIYSQCFTSSGLKSLNSCRILDNRLGDIVSYSIYILDYGHGLKVGSTRSWRLYDRVAEQPHVVAIEFVRYKSAFQTRDLELRIGGEEGFTERPKKRSLRDIVACPPRASYKRLYDAVKKLSRRLGIELSEPRFFRILPGTDIAWYARAREVDASSIYGKRLELIDYWAGYLLLSEGDTGYIIVKTRELLHCDSLGVVK